MKQKEPIDVSVHELQYRLLTRLKLSAHLDFRPQGLTVVVGPNSGGKTRLLRDIHNAVSGGGYDFVVAKEIELSKPTDVEEFLRDLENMGYIQSDGVDPSAKNIKPQRSNAGLSRGLPHTSKNETRQWLDGFKIGRAHV